MDQINFLELGGVSGKSTFHPEGDEIIHPSGIRYKRIKGNWTVISHPVVKTESDEHVSEDDPR